MSLLAQGFTKICFAVLKLLQKDKKCADVDDRNISRSDTEKEMSIKK